MMQQQHPAEREQQRTPAKPAGELVDLLVGDWRPSGEQILQWVRIAVAVGSVLLVVLLILYVIGLIFSIPLLNLLKILAIPITVGAAVPLLDWLQKQRELDVEKQRAQDDALQAYLGEISQLLTDKDRPLHRAQQGDRLSTVARARTLTVLDTLDSGRLKGLEALDSGRRKRRVLKFLYEANLIRVDSAIVRLSKVNLSKADLSKADLSKADLSGADLSGADLSGADLSEADLCGANLSEAKLNGAILNRAQLGTARVSVVLPDGGAEPAEPNPVDLRQADLSQANLQWAQGWTYEQLDQAESLEGATMPDGTQYEDWVKRGWLRQRSRKGDREDGGTRALRNT
jgi:uncharacterized protein YjbI with pentapeptide repeats